MRLVGDISIVVSCTQVSCPGLGDVGITGGGTKETKTNEKRGTPNPVENFVYQPHWFISASSCLANSKHFLIGLSGILNCGATLAARSRVLLRATLPSLSDSK